jgi:protein involved in plasmid replication-relaxation
MASQSFARGAGTGARRKDSEDAAVLAASGHLTGRDRHLVRMIGQHRVLTTDQLCALAFENIITARHRLGVLVRIGMLRRFRPRREVGSAPWHYLLGPIGAALLGAEDRNEKKWVPQVRADRQLSLERSQRLAHMVGRNWFFVALAAEARRGGGELRADPGQVAQRAGLDAAREFRRGQAHHDLGGAAERPHPVAGRRRPLELERDLP